MKIVYMGTPDFAVPALEALYKAGHDIAYVVTQPDSVRDRGRKVKFSPVKEKALELGLEVFQPKKLKTECRVHTETERHSPGCHSCSGVQVSCCLWKFWKYRKWDASIYMARCCPDSEVQHLYREQ